MEHPTVVILALVNTDLETAALSTNPEFLALIERSRAACQDRGQALRGGDARRILPATWIMRPVFGAHQSRIISIENTIMTADLVVSTAWLAEHLNDPNVRVVDMRGYVVTRPIAAGVEQADYRGARGRISGRPHPGRGLRRLDARHHRPGRSRPRPDRAAGRFAEAMAQRGIGDDTLVVAVDHTGGQFATRLWWALSYYGHDPVRVLDGGWNAWVREGRPVEAGEVAVARAVFTPGPRPACA